MCHIHSTLEKIAFIELESIFAAGECEGSDIGCTLRQTWEGDKRASLDEAQRKFQEDQAQQTGYDPQSKPPQQCLTKSSLLFLLDLLWDLYKVVNFICSLAVLLLLLGMSGAKA